MWSDGFDNRQDCWKLNTFCRDVLATPGMDEWGQGATPAAFHNSGMTGLVLAVLSGAIASALVMLAIRGGIRRDQRDEYGDVQFSAIRGHETMID